jgi:hypothetical protein
MPRLSRISWLPLVSECFLAAVCLLMFVNYLGRLARTGRLKCARHIRSSQQFVGKFSPHPSRGALALLA